MNKLPRYHTMVCILTCSLLGKLLPSYGAIDRSQKQNGGGHWFPYRHIEGVVLTVADANLTTRQINQLYSI